MKKIISTAHGVTKGIFNTFRKIIPINTKMVTNESVRNYYINNLNGSNWIQKSAIKYIENLVNHEKIIPVACTEKFIEDLNKKLSGDACMNPQEYENVFGFYTGEQNRIYILLDNIERLSGSDKTAISNVTIHELQHMSCYNHMNEFMRTWGDELYEFYAHFAALLYKTYISGIKSTWQSLTGEDKSIVNNLLNPDNGIKYFVNYIAYNHEYLFACAGANMSTTDCRMVGEKFAYTLQNCGCSEDISYKIGGDVAQMVYDIFTGRIGETYKTKSNLNIIKNFALSYIKIFGRNPLDIGDFIYQEMVFPSEVICVSSNLKKPTDSRYYKFLNRL